MWNKLVDIGNAIMGICMVTITVTGTFMMLWLGYCLFISDDCFDDIECNKFGILEERIDYLEDDLYSHIEE